MRSALAGSLDRRVVTNMASFAGHADAISYHGDAGRGVTQDCCSSSGDVGEFVLQSLKDHELS